MDGKAHERDATQQGFTLTEVIIAVVVVAILAGVALVGIASMTKTSSTTACGASANAAMSASAAYYTQTETYPTQWTDMTTATPPVYEPASGETINSANPQELDDKHWTLTMAGGGATEPTFTCS